MLSISDTLQGDRFFIEGIDSRTGKAPAWPPCCCWCWSLWKTRKIVA